MSCVQYENFQIETPSAQQEPKPYVIAPSRAKVTDAASRVAEALDLVLANGSMPA